MLAQGTLGIESAVDVGSTFSVEFPASVLPPETIGLHTDGTQMSTISVRDHSNAGLIPVLSPLPTPALNNTTAVSSGRRASIGVHASAAADGSTSPPGQQFEQGSRTDIVLQQQAQQQAERDVRQQSTMLPSSSARSSALPLTLPHSLTLQVQQHERSDSSAASAGSVHTNFSLSPTLAHSLAFNSSVQLKVCLHALSLQAVYAPLHTLSHAQRKLTL